MSASLALQAVYAAAVIAAVARICAVIEPQFSVLLLHVAAFGWALALQRMIPRLPPRALTAALKVVGRERPCRRAFDWYLEQAHPRAAS